MTSALLGTNLQAKTPLALDIERLLITRLLVQANSGGGKSWLLRRLLEQTFGLVPQVVLDVDDEFHTLREKYPYVLAGAAGADCRADPRTAPLLARRILEHGFSTIVSIAELKHHERLRFVRLFLEALVESPRALWRPLLIVVDEAHLFCPEKNPAESAAAVIDLMTRGRKRGFCGVLATQRISKLNKDAAAEANNKLIGRSSLDVDMKRAADELGFTSREEQHQLRALDEGAFYCFGPALSRTVTLIKVGPVQTTHLEPGDRRSAPPPPPPEKLKAILAKLADLPKDAEAEEGELARLRRENAELRQKNADLGARHPDPDPAALDAAWRNGKIEGYGAAIADLTPMLERVKTLRVALDEQLESFVQDLQSWSKRTAHAQALVKPGMGARIPLPAPAPKAPAPRAAARADKPESLISSPQQRVLDALAWMEAVGISLAEKTQLALLADQSPKSSGYQNNLGFLRSAGLIDYPGAGLVELTDAGRAAARAPARSPTTADLHRTLETKLPSSQWRILAALIRAYPDAIQREEVARQADASATSSGFQNNLGALRSLGFIDYPTRGFVAALPVLFLENR